MRLLWHSNSPLAPTGYGQQTALFAPYLADHCEDFRISSFYGLEGAPIKWEGIKILPGVGGEYGNTSVIEHAQRCWGGDPRGGLVVTLMDVWVLDAPTFAKMNVASWVPIDHDPAPPQVIEFFIESGAVPIAMSRFGERMLGRLDPLYVPHGVDTDVYKPMGREQCRGGSFPEGAFVIGMVAANKGRPSRKGFSQALQAFKRFSDTHENAYLHLHTMIDPSLAGGENIPALIRSLEIPMEKIRIADQYAMQYEPYSHAEMARLYSAFDVLLNPALGEGFGIPVLEAQACGTPAIVTDFSAMTEVCGAGWHVKHSPYWTGLNSWQAVPDVDDIVAALEECHAMKPAQAEKMSQTARKHACTYDARRVVKQYWLPALRTITARFENQQPVTIKPRKMALPTVEGKAA
jgi:glycosyltransferase involved in cell wall biosynthesis